MVCSSGFEGFGFGVRGFGVQGFLVGGFPGVDMLH